MNVPASPALNVKADAQCDRLPPLLKAPLTLSETARIRPVASWASRLSGAAGMETHAEPSAASSASMREVMSVKVSFMCSIFGAYLRYSSTFSTFT